MLNIVSPPHFCWICGYAVDLRECKIDEHGNAVHEKCYAAKLALATESIFPTTTDQLRGR